MHLLRLFCFLGNAHLRRGVSLNTIVADGGTVAAQPNLPALARIGYSVAGLLLVYLGFTQVESVGLRYFLPLLGGFVLVEGIIGYCVMLAAFGLRRRT